MDWFIGLTLALTVVVALVTVIGHGIWLAIAALFRGPNANQNRDAILSGSEQSRQPDLVTFEQQLDQFHKDGRIDDAVHQQMKHAVAMKRWKAGLPPTVTVEPPELVEQEPAQEATVDQAKQVEVVPSEVAASEVAPTPASETSVYIAKIATDNATETVPSTAPTPPPVPAQPMAKVLAVFMEESNIRWIDLIGGMLIVGCSAGLVSYFWSDIAATPFLKFFIFTAVTAVLIGAGLYTEHRWRLPTTSRGVLIITSLLTPLNFLAIAAFSEGAPTTALPIIGELVAITLFAWLMLLTGRVIAPVWPMLLPVGIVGSSAAILLLRRLIEAETGDAVLLAAGALPVAFHLGTCGEAVRRIGAWRSVGRTKANSLFVLLGVTWFAAALGLGLLLHKSGQVGESLRAIAPLLTLMGLPALFGGLMLWKRISAKALGAVRTAGTAVAIAGVFVCLAALAVAWPHAAMLLPVALLTFVVLSVAAVKFDMPVAHIVAGVFLTLAYLVTWHVVSGETGWHDGGAVMMRALVGAKSGVSLAVLSAVFVAIAVTARRTGKKKPWLVEAAPWYGWLAAGVSAISLLLVTRHGFGRQVDHGATFVYAAYAAAALLAAWRLRSALPAWIGVTLLAVTLVQAIAYRFAPDWSLDVRWQAALLIHATIGAATAVAIRAGRERFAVFAGAVNGSAIATSIIAAVLILGNLSITGAGGSSARVGWLAAVWLTLALAQHSAVLFIAFQAAFTVSMALAVTANLSGRPWFNDREALHPLVHPWSIQAHAIALALLSLIWITLRLGVMRRVRLRPSQTGQDWRAMVIVPAWPVDRVINVALAFVLIALAAYSVLPAVVVEFTRGSQAAYVSNHSLNIAAAGVGSWVMLALIAVLFIAWMWRRFETTRVLGLLALCVIACMLVATRWGQFGAGASALRWALAMFAPVLVAASFNRQRLVQWFAPLRWPNFPQGAIDLDRNTRMVGDVLVIGPIVAITLAAASSILIRMDKATVLAASGPVFSQISPTVSYLSPLVLLALVFAARGAMQRSAGSMAASGLMINLAVTMGWLIHVAADDGSLDGDDLVHAVQLNAVAMSGVALLWLGARTGWLMRPLRDPAPGAPGAPGHSVWMGFQLFVPMAAMIGVVAIGLMLDLSGQSLATHNGLAWSALGVVAATMLASLWDRFGSFALPALYALGLTAIATALDQMNLSQRWLAWNGAMWIPAYTAVIASAWSLRHRFERLRELLRLPPFDACEKWLTPTTLALGGMATLLVFIVVLSFTAERLDHSASFAQRMRLLVAAAMFVQVAAIAMLGHGQRSSPLRKLTCFGLVVAGVAFGWAWMTPIFGWDRVLDRAVVVLVTTVVAITLYGIGLVKLIKRTSDWTRDAAATLPWIAGCSAITMIFVLGMEVIFAFTPWGATASTSGGAVTMSAASNIVMIISLVGSTVLAIVFAVVPGRDPFKWDERGRMRYVYLAEMIAGLTFMHIRLTMPWMFSGWFMQYWTLIVMAIAFLAVGLSELFRRQQRMVLAIPMENSGALLPLLPTIGFWVGQPKLHYSLLLLSAGMLYGLMWVLRRQFRFAVLAGLAANAALWYFLHRTQDFQLLDHPQLWFIPVALSMLGAAYLNRDRLTDAQMVATRYICVVCIYVSSTADLFLNAVRDGIEHSPWLPMILAGLSVAGVIAGIAMRVRSFLYTGTAFLLLALTTIIWHASARLEWTWLWYVAGIVLGMGLIATWAMFEKQRPKMMARIEQMRQWEG